MPSAAPSLSTNEQSLLQQLAAVVEPLTRFDAGSLQSLGATTETISVTARLRFQIAFTTDCETQAGPLPRHITDVGSAAILAQNLQHARQNAYTLLPERLKNWQARYADISDAKPTTRDCLAEDALSGYDGGCTACSHTGQVRCGRCGGQKQYQCDLCSGQGKQACGSCNGNGNISCGGCDGRGQWMETRTRTYSTGTHGDQVQHTETYYVPVICNTCGGSGSRTCAYCVGGEVICTRCQGQKMLACVGCQATGWVQCRPCAGTGQLHEIGSLRCEVTSTFRVEAHTVRQEVQQCLAARQSLAQLRVVARLDVCEAQYGIAFVERVYSGKVDVTTLSLRAVGVPLDILGYGVPPRIFDYKNIVGHLLEADLEALETALHTKTKQPVRAHSNLETALVGFLASPANVQLGKQTFQAAASTSLDPFPAAVSPDYSARAVAALGESLTRVYGRATPFTLAGLLLLPLPLLFWADATKTLTLGLYSPVMTALGTGLAAVALECLALERVRRLLGPALRPLASDALAAQGALRKRRRLLVASVIGGALIGWFGTAMLAAFLWVQKH